MATVPRRGRPKIPPPRKNGPEFSAERTWAQLSKNIREIQKQNASNLSFEENHRYAYNMVLNRHGEMLYRGVKQLVVENLESMAKERIIPKFPSGTTDVTVQSSDASLLLVNVKNVWEEHNSNMVRLGQILRYMDRVYVTTANVSPTCDLGQELFLDHIMSSPIVDHVIDSILNQIRHERNRCDIASSTVKGCVDIFLSLQLQTEQGTIYKRDLEPKILEQSEAFYSKEGVHLLSSCDGPEFLKQVENRFLEEDRRTHHYLSSQTTAPLLEILKSNLLSPHLSTVIMKEGSGLDTMIDNSKFEDLSRLFKLCIMVPTALGSLSSALKGSILRRGKQVNEASSSDLFVEIEGHARETDAKRKGKARSPPTSNQPALQWMQSVLDLKDRFDRIWKTSFQSNRELESSMNNAFSLFINMNQKCSEFISLFIDEHLKKGLKGKSEVEVDAVLDQTISVFRFITEKDVFEKYYKGHLAKRLLNGRSVSDDAERGMLAKLKTECGFQFTQKMEGMFNDMRLSVEATKDYMSKTNVPGLELSVIVMTSGAWPMSHSQSPCVLPPQMHKACKSFEQFYLSRHSGRRLTWQCALGNADVVVRFEAGCHELNVATFALAILLLFEDLEDEQSLTYTQIKEATGINEPELKRHLQSLACAKERVLKKHPAGREINPTDDFSFNNDFSSQKRKIRIATISSKIENNAERQETLGRIDEERKYLMELCIVRIMKHRKIMTHNDLVNEVTSQLSSKFQPEPLVIKKRIEHLIDREYMARGEDRRSYSYI